MQPIRKLYLEDLEGIATHWKCENDSGSNFSRCPNKTNSQTNLIKRILQGGKWETNQQPHSDGKIMLPCIKNI